MLSSASSASLTVFLLPTETILTMLFSQRSLTLSHVYIFHDTHFLVNENSKSTLGIEKYIYFLS